jgi:ribosomal protein L11 methyltransferase
VSEPRYPYVHVDVSAEDAELVASELFDLGAQGLEERDASTLNRPQDGAAGMLTLVASFADDESARAAQAALGERYAARIEHVVGDAWRDGWRAYFKPMRVGKRLVIKPSWEPYEPVAGDVVLTLDPGQAFGTGTHETTRLLLAELEARLPPAARVLDVGTGSGILGVACLLLGASSVEALDNDPLAVDAARENAERNGVGAKLHASLTPVGTLTTRYPLVLANIEARVLIPEAANVAARVEPGGLLLLSGLLHTDVDSVRAAYPGFTELGRPELGEWRALVLREGRS